MKRICLLLAALLATAPAARASTWNGIFSSDWFTSGNWDSFNGPPGPLDTAFFPTDVGGGFALPRTDVNLSGTTIISAATFDSPVNAQYTLNGAAGVNLIMGAALTVKNTDLQPLNVLTFSTLGVTCDTVSVSQNAILSLNTTFLQANTVPIFSTGRIDINSGSVLQTPIFGMADAASEIRVNNGGELRLTGSFATVNGTLTLNPGGQLTISSGKAFGFTAASLFQLNTGYGLSDGATLEATAGGDIHSTSFIDIGNGRTGTLLVDGSGSTFTSSASTCDWGLSSSGNSTVTISTSAVATVLQLRAGTSDAKFVGSVTSSASLHVTSTFSMGGGTVSRQVSLGVGGGTFQVDGSATFNNKADLTLSSGSVTFNGGATFNAGSRFDWTGGTLNLAANSILLVDGGVVARTVVSGLVFTGNTTLRLRNNASFSTPSYFDLQDATLDMDNSGLGVAGTSAIVTDWGFGTTTVTLANNANATYFAPLNMSTSTGTTNVTLSSGSKLVASTIAAGGNSNSHVSITLNAATLQSAGTISLLRGTTATVNSNGKIQAADLVIGSSTAASLTVTGSGALANPTNSLTINPGGALSIHSSGAVTPGGATTLNAGSTLIIDTAGRLSTNSLTATAASLSLSLSGTIATTGATILNSGSTLSIDSVGAQNAAALTTGTFASSSATLSLSFTSHVPTIPVTVTSTNGLTINSLNLQISASSAPLGSYDIIRYTGNIQGAGLATVTLPAVQTNIAYTLAITTDGLSNLVTLHKGFLGDTNDDGIVNIDDYLTIDRAFLRHTPNPTWFNGDFNTDGTINGTDYALIDFAFQHPNGGMSGLISEHAAEFGEPYLATLAALEASDVAAVPEPSSVCLLGLAGTALLRRPQRLRS